MKNSTYLRYFFNVTLLILLSSFFSCQVEKHHYPFEKFGEIQLDKEYTDQFIIPYFQDGKYGLEKLKRK